VRTFVNGPLQEDHRQMVDNLVAEKNEAPGPFGTSSRVINLEISDKELDRMKVSTYGMIKSPRGFIVGVCRNDNKELIDIGHNLEDIVLRLTAAGLGTCWLSGTFKRADVLERVDLAEGELFAAVIPYGYPSEKKRFMESLVKSSARSHKRKPVDKLFFRGDFSTPVEEAEGRGLKDLIESVRLAPSSMNKQPWRVVLDQGMVHLYLQRSANYISDRFGFDLHMLDMGIAMRHMEAVCDIHGHDVEWLFDDPGIVMRNDGMEHIASMDIVGLPDD